MFLAVLRILRVNRTGHQQILDFEQITEVVEYPVQHIVKVTGERIAICMTEKAVDLVCYIPLEACHAPVTRLIRDRWLDKRHRIAKRYDESLKGLPVTPQHRPNDSYSAMHLFVVRMDTEKTDKTHQQVFAELRNSGIGVNLHYIPVHLQPWYQSMGFKKGDYPEAEKYYSQAISLPIYPDLSDQQFTSVVEALRTCLE